MQHIHAREYLQAGATIRVDCDYQCNVMVMTDRDYSAYRRGAQFEYYGGHYTQLPAFVQVPHTGRWNTVIDLGGGSARIRYDISYIG